MCMRCKDRAARETAVVGAVILIGVAVYVGAAFAVSVYAQSATPSATLTATAALAEITKLREDKARLEAILVDRDRQIANIRYQLGKQVLELEADVAELRLNQRAEPILRSLRELLKPDPDAKIDWRTGTFVAPPKPKPEPKPEEKK